MRNNFKVVFNLFSGSGGYIADDNEGPGPAGNGVEQAGADGSGGQLGSY